ncbi:hypothetical protein TYRP_021059 [Tyrophagus putrescentiae]|nr:hypothetical protein TYRP_021059 [Tyrophagus putrescentiae]
MLHSSIQSSSSVNTVPPQHHLPQHPPHYRYAAAIIGGAVLITCCQNLDEGRQAGHLKPAKVILMAVLLVNSIVLLYALLDGWAEEVLGPGDHLEMGRTVLVGGALLSMLFLAALFYLDSLLLVGVFAMLVVLAAISTSVATVRLQYPPLWLEVILLSLMAVCSLLLMLNYAADKRERPGGRRS